MTASAASSSPSSSGEELPLMVVMPPNLILGASDSCERVSLLPLKATSTSTQGAPAGSLYACRGLIYVAISAVCFSLVSTCAKYATYSISSMEFILWRSIIALGLNYVGMRYYGESLTIRPKQRHNLLVQCLFGFASVAFGFYAMSQMVLADASVIIFTSPAVTFIFGACLLKEKVDPASFACALVACLGLVFVLRPTFLFGDNSTASASGSMAVPIGCAMAAAICQALLYTSVRRLQGIHFLTIVHYFMVFSIIVATLWIVLVQGQFHELSFRVCMVLFAAGAWTFLGQISLTKGFQLEKAGIAAVMRYLDVVCVFIWDILLLHERVSTMTMLGAVIICSCAGVIAMRKANEK